MKKHNIGLATYKDWSKEQIDQFNIDVKQMSEEQIIDKYSDEIDVNSNKISTLLAHKRKIDGSL